MKPQAFSIIALAVLAFGAPVFSGRASAQEQAVEKSEEILGTWFAIHGKHMYIQQFQDDKISSYRVSQKSKIIEIHGCKAFDFNGRSFSEKMIFASDEWAEYIGKSEHFATKFEASSFLRHKYIPYQLLPEGSIEKWETWSPMKPLPETPEINGVWVNKTGLREFTLKSFRDGYCFTTEVETVASKARRATISTFTLSSGLLTETILYASEERKARLGVVTSVTVEKNAEGLIFKEKKGATELWTRAPKNK